jgi:hypothetical protein
MTSITSRTHGKNGKSNRCCGNYYLYKHYPALPYSLLPKVPSDFTEPATKANSLLPIVPSAHRRNNLQQGATEPPNSSDRPQTIAERTAKEGKFEQAKN